ncbi:MAG: HEAT repeat domain-containing protein [Chloroflexota bacterium]
MSEWIGQLQNPDSRQRKAGIAALAKSKDTTALGDLEHVSNHDPDEQIRQYAAQAIRYIKKQTTVDYAVNAEPGFLRNAIFHDEPIHQPLAGIRGKHWWIPDLTFHLLVNVLGCLLVAILVLPRFASAFQTWMSNAPVDEANILLRLTNALVNAHLNELIVAGILLGIFSVFASFLTFRLTHQVAVHIFGGANTFPGMLHDVLTPYTIISAIVYVIFFVASWANPLVILNTGNSSLSFLVTFVITFMYGAAYVVLGYFLGKAYAFGTSKGCLSIVTAFVLCGVGSFLLGTLFGTH